MKHVVSMRRWRRWGAVEDGRAGRRCQGVGVGGRGVTRVLHVVVVEVSTARLGEDGANGGILFFTLRFIPFL